MSIEKLVLQNRSYRTFDESAPITADVMRELVDLARKTASGMNKQPLRYRILCEEADITKMMGNCRFEWTGAVLSELGGTSAGLYSVQLVANNAGGNGHPTLDAQISNSTILANFIKENVLK